MEQQTQTEWYKKWWGILIAIFIWPYFLIWYLWAKSKLNVKTKTFITIAVLILVIVIGCAGDTKKEIGKNETRNTVADTRLTPEQAEKIQQAKILAEQEAQKKKEEEEKAKIQAEEEKRMKQAEDYCAKRKDVSGWYFWIFRKEYIITKDNGAKSYDGDSVKKKGSQLTKEDCRKIVDFMYDWKTEKMDDVIERTYWIGMSNTELMLSVGLPTDINKENYGNGVREQWIYPKDSYGINAYYFYVENNQVTSYQDF